MSDHSPSSSDTSSAAPAAPGPRLSKAEIVTLARRVIFGLFLAGLLLLNYQVLHLFFVPVAWALILAYLTWPLYRRLRRVSKRAGLSALLMTLALAALFVIPMLWVVALIQAELPETYRTVSQFITQPPAAALEPLTRIPLLGPEIEQLLQRLPENPSDLRKELILYAKPLADDAANVLGGFTRNLVKFGFALMTVFFIYRHGEDILSQTRRVLRRFLGSREAAYLNAIADTSRAVMYGIVLTALAQGVLAGIGYMVAGVPAALLLGALTAILALIPFGPPLIWVPVCLWLLYQGHYIAGIGLFIWGVVAVSWVDNLVRPLVISGATQIPFLLVMFSVLGGVAAFGLLGLFLGPIAVAVLLAVWREWLGDQHELVAGP